MRIKSLLKNHLIFSIVSASASIMLIAVSPATAQVKENNMNLDLSTSVSIGIDVMEVVLFLASSTAASLAEHNNRLNGQKGWSAYTPSLLFLLSSLLFFLVAGFIIGQFDAIMMGTIIVNAIFFLYFLMMAFVTSSVNN